jgi:hypothetical protein
MNPRKDPSRSPRERLFEAQSPAFLAKAVQSVGLLPQIEKLFGVQAEAARSID